MRPTCLAALLILLASPLVLATDVEVSHIEGTDFASYRTYVWGEGAPAVQPGVQEQIVEVVDRELTAKGLLRVVGGQADLVVKTWTMSLGGADLRGNEFHGVWGGELTMVDMRTYTRGALIVQLLEPGAEEPVWKGIAKATLIETTPKKIRKKVDGAARKLFRKYPPG